jgi:uncharacterized membrane protein YhaH (DUF805 family)
MNNLLSMKGRINRARHIIGVLVIGGVTGSAMSLVSIALSSKLPTIEALMCLFVLLAAVVFGAFQAVKRLHDIDRPGTHYWLLYVPFYNIYLFVLLLFKKGTVGPNRYGPDPLAVQSVAVTTDLYSKIL